jgi:hypothetical protein
MKTVKFIVLGLMMILAGSMHGQVSVSVNIGVPPAWGPAGYQDVRYYYLPDIECYYDIHTSMFIYFSGNRWVHRRYLPARYRDYDLYHGYKVVMNDYWGNTPYHHFREYRMKYGKGYRGPEQHYIGERHDNRERGRGAFQQNRKDDRRDYRAPGRNDNRNNDRMNGKGPVRGNNRDHFQGNNRAQSQENGKSHDHGNDKNKKDGRDDGNRR